MSFEANTETVNTTENGANGGARPASDGPPAAPDPATDAALQRVSDDLLRILSARSPRQKLWAKVWRRSHPELVKVYGIIHNHMVELQRLVLLRRAAPPPGFEAVERQLQSFLNENYDELRELNIHAAWEYAGALERFLLLLADDEYLTARLLHEQQREKQARPGAWSEYFAAEELTALVASFAARPVAAGARTRALECLAYVYAERIRYVRHQRAREELRADYLNGLTFFLTLLLLLLLECIHLVVKADDGGLSRGVRSLIWSALTFDIVVDLRSPEIRSALVAAATGALGSTLSGFYRLRDEAGGITALRAFRSAMWAQPFVGAVVGVLLWLLLMSKLLNVAVTVDGQLAWSSLAIYCFLAGFSEPFFLGVVQRVAGAADKDTTRKDAGTTKP